MISGHLNNTADVLRVNIIMKKSPTDVRYTNEVLIMLSVLERVTRFRKFYALKHVHSYKFYSRMFTRYTDRFMFGDIYFYRSIKINLIYRKHTISEVGAN